MSETGESPLDDVGPLSAEEIARAWERELPGVATSSILLLTPLWRVAKLLADQRRRTLRTLGMDAGTLDLVSTLRRSGPPYSLTTRQLGEQSLVTAGAISQRVARAEEDGLVVREPSAAARRAVAVTLTSAGHAEVERVVASLLAHEERILECLTPAQRAALEDGLASLLDDLLSDDPTEPA
ncbi:MarR family winged helix-turn-helix transcriptional regulator [Mumia sp. zg.B53]|uniref:MarR family winged helix-turn-helix transcriptional regulator n=1 Tax=Mumia sp. zg.B53 TaxID=2855449 RepID=UPI001C6E6BD2|nr:MarR family winged helix-turn-helix transcriptional regulator [Mumia sp. zg.B53]MBW9215087.1 MarR family winged helix-turn-helix transcriptional regulator [Mumia sp. zg.B53]